MRRHVSHALGQDDLMPSLVLRTEARLDIGPISISPYASNEPDEQLYLGADSNMVVIGMAAVAGDAVLNASAATQSAPIFTRWGDALRAVSVL